MDPLSGYLDRLASPAPTPGGGSAATIVAAAAAALVEMTAQITAANSKYAAKANLALELTKRARILRTQLLAARERDEAAFSAVMAARGDEKQQALYEAAQAPLDAMTLALDVQRLAVDGFSLNNPHLESDLGCAGEFAAAALAALAYNVRVNHKFMRDAEAVDKQRSRMKLYEDASAALINEIRAKLR